MKITNTEIAELLIAVGTALKAAATANVQEESAVTAGAESPITGQLVQGSFEDPEQPSGDVQSVQPDVNSTIVSSSMNEADKRILELEAELRRVKNVGSNLDLQPIKLATNNNEVRHG